MNNLISDQVWTIIQNVPNQVPNHEVNNLNISVKLLKAKNPQNVTSQQVYPPISSSTTIGKHVL